MSSSAQVPTGDWPPSGLATRTQTGAAHPSDEVAPTIPGFEVLGELGRGGMGVVFRARHVALNREVALKTLRTSGAPAEVIVRFLAEAETVARLQHPNVVQVYEVGRTEGRPFFAMELCAGGSLTDRLDGSPWPPATAARLIETMARAADFAHSRGVVHRDIKPSNVLFQDTVPKLGDFGLAKRVELSSGLTQTGAVLGTPSYMAPEQASGDTKVVGPAADVYALGAVLYELLTGRPPFKASNAIETIMQVRTDDPVPPRRLQPKTPRDLETIVLKCLHKDASGRYSSAASLADDLRRFNEGLSIHARPAGAVEKSLRWCRRKPGLATALTVLAMVIVGTVVGSVITTFHIGRINQDLSGALSAAQEQSTANTQLLHRLAVDAGVRAGESGDWLLALNWFATALDRYPPDDTTAHTARVRLACYLRQGPRLVGTMPGENWKFHPQLDQALVERDGRVEIVALPNGVTLHQMDLPRGVKVLDYEWSQHGNRVLLHIAPSNDTTNQELRVWDIAAKGWAGPPLRPAKSGGLGFFADAAAERVLLLTGEFPQQQLWSVSTGKPLGSAHKLRHHRDVCIGLSCDGQTYATMRQVDENPQAIHDEVRLWNAVDGTPALQGRELWTSREGIRPDWTLAADFRSPNHLDIFDLRGHRMPRRVNVPTRGGTQAGAPIFGWIADRIAHCPVSRRLAVAANQDIEDSGGIQNFRSFASVISVAGGDVLEAEPGSTPSFTPDGRWLRGHSANLLFSTQNGLRRMVTLPVLSRDTGKFSPSARWLLESDGQQTLVWMFEPKASGARVSAEQVFGTLPNHYSVDGSRALVESTEGDLTIVDAKTGVRLFVLARSNPPYKWDLPLCKFSPDGNAILLVRYIGNPVPDHYDVTVVDAVTGTPRFAPQRFAQVGCPRFSRDGRQVFIHAETKLHRIDALSGEAKDPIIRHSEWIAGSCTSPDERLVAVFGGDGRCDVYDLISGHAVGAGLRSSDTFRDVVIQDGDELGRVAFNGVGDLLLLAGKNGGRLWDWRTGMPAGPPLPHPAQVHSWELHTNDRWALLVGSGAARVWDVHNGQPVTPLLTAYHASFTRDGKGLIVGDSLSNARYHSLEPMDGSSGDIAKIIRFMHGQQIDPQGGVASFPREVDAPVWRQLHNKYLTLVESDPESPADWHFRQASECFTTNLHGSAVFHLNHAEQHRPLDTSSREMRGIALYHENRYAEAERDFTELLGSDPRNVQWRWYRAECLSMLGRWADAATELAVLAEVQPNDEGIRRRHALALLAQGDLTGYRRACVDFFDGRLDLNADNLGSVLKLCAAVPSAVDDLSAILKLAERLPNEDLPLRRLLQVRAGRGEDLRPELANWQVLPANGPIDMAMHVLVHYLVGERAAGGNLRIGLEQKYQELAANDFDDVDWCDRVLLETMRAEVRGGR